MTGCQQPACGWLPPDSSEGTQALLDRIGRRLSDNPAMAASARRWSSDNRSESRSTPARQKESAAVRHGKRVSSREIAFSSVSAECPAALRMTPNALRAVVFCVIRPLWPAEFSESSQSIQLSRCLPCQRGCFGRNCHQPPGFALGDHPATGSPVPASL